MEIILLNGNPNRQNASFDTYLEQLETNLHSAGHSVTNFTLRNMDIHYCIGCLDCWIKTPGMCVTEDQGREICKAYVNADFVLWASPVIMGFYSALLKKVTDKFVGLVHPYGEFVDGEVHHFPRYDKYPLTGLLLEKDADTDDEDIEITSEIHSRTTLNFKSSTVFTKTTTAPVEEVADAIMRV